MVLRKKTELQSKLKGMERAEKCYNKKIKEQKENFNRRIEIYEQNIEKKNILIDDLIKEIKCIQKNTNNVEINTDIVRTFEKCVNVIEKDISITSRKNADIVLRNIGNMPTL